MTDTTTTTNDEQLPGTSLHSVSDPDTAQKTFTEHNIQHARVAFHPQEKSHNMIHPVGEVIEFTVPIEIVLTDDGALVPEETSQMDALKHHATAPRDVNEWDGPFEVYYQEFLDKTRYNAETVVVTFHPMVPVSGRLVIPDDTWTYRVPVEAVLDDEGNVLEDDTVESDWLARHTNAPPIAQEWTDITDWCYKITIDDVPAVVSPDDSDGQ